MFMAYPKPAPERTLVETDLGGLRRWTAQRRRAGERIGLVPTMGALHDGHLALVAALGARVDRVAVTIFVNPTQFAAGEDFALYPRQEAEDVARLAAAGVDLVYMPDVGQIYPAGFATEISVGGTLTQGLEAAARPGHFTGVATVVAKLLLQAMPDVAAFGEKDYQQLRVVRRLAHDLDLQVEIMAVPTVRDAHGLALSSRNAYLNAAELAVARRLNQVLAETAGRLRAGAPAAIATAEAERALIAAGFSSVDYVVLADAETLAPLESLAPLDGLVAAGEPARLLAAARIGRTRLIDNIPVTPNFSP
jgi:pantoate--beta-alanine ligase